MKVLVTGGARSGKSRFALELAESLSPVSPTQSATVQEPVRFYVATAQALDAEMEARIAAHRRERGPGWHTIEEPLDIARCLAQPGPVVVDCLTLWLSNLLMRESSDADVATAIDGLVEAFAAAENPVIVITNEVGSGIVPENALARRFRDLAGISSQRMARAARRVVLLCAGIPLEVKSS